ncbi:alanine racemase [Thalassospira mesophila]|uniref:Alanine racemase n=1 Tax=Thalassospira mesophila TaxID=1293891 RepID=A0A1Y2KZH0_9PROT|nr:alanine racemase [Thalassospira mesophila]OSQ38099.1 alanine racemase [Thalassospira mesophila]
MTEFAELDTPCAIVDLDCVERNIRTFQEYCDEHDIALRPHIKTHKIPDFALQQIAVGAKGITCQKIGEAEIMTDAGIGDILITYNIIGARKLARLRTLADRIDLLRVVVDSETVARGLSGAFADGQKPLEVLVECDTGAGRCGVQSPTETANLARVVDALPGLKFVGLMTYPPNGGMTKVETFFRDAMAKCANFDLECPVRSSGGTPDMWQAHKAPVVTEYRIGTYIYNDKSVMARGGCLEEDCALRVLTEIVSLPAPGRAIIDAGSKALTSDLFGLEHFGYVVGHGDVTVKSLSEEHGILTFDPATQPFEIGQRLQIIPNHVCVVSNMFDYVQLCRNGIFENPAFVAARGKMV